jgi:putative spermidine/putrescine transport system permease protein
VVTLFITSLRVFTLPRRMWDGIREHVDPTIAAAATSLLLLTLLGIVCHLILARRRAAQMRKERR